MREFQHVSTHPVVAPAQLGAVKHGIGGQQHAGAGVTGRIGIEVADPPQKLEPDVVIDLVGKDREAEPGTKRGGERPPLQRGRFHLAVVNHFGLIEGERVVLEVPHPFEIAVGLVVLQLVNQDADQVAGAGALPHLPQVQGGNGEAAAVSLFGHQQAAAERERGHVAAINRGYCYGFAPEHALPHLTGKRGVIDAGRADRFVGRARCGDLGALSGTGSPVSAPAAARKGEAQVDQQHEPPAAPFERTGKRR